MLVSGRANRELAARIASKLGVGSRWGVTLNTFSNGEVYCRYEESVRGADVFIVQPMSANLEEGLGRPTRQSLITADCARSPKQVSDLPSSAEGSSALKSPRRWQ